MKGKPRHTENELILLIQQKNQKAFSYLYDNYSAALYTVILKIVPDEAEAEDILQKTFIKIWYNFSGFEKEKGRLYTWMLNIARNAAIDHTRSKQNKDSLKNIKTSNAVQAINSQYQFNVNYDSIGLKNVLAQLTEEQQNLIGLVYYEGYTQEEIAKKLNLPLGTVKTKIRKALMTLRKIIK